MKAITNTFGVLLMVLLPLMPAYGEEDQVNQFEWQLDLGLAINYSRSWVEGLNENGDGFGINIFLSGGMYYGDFFVEASPTTLHPLTLGYVLQKTDTYQINVVAESWFFEISEENQADGSDNLTGLSDRKASMEAGIEYLYTNQNFDIRLRVLHDVLGRHEGAVATFEIAKPIYSRTTLWLPAISLTLISEDAVDYYYGVRPHEVRSDRPEYAADSAWIAAIQLYAERPFSTDWSIIGFAGYALPSDAITDSPIVSPRSNTYNVGLGVLWTF